MKLKPTRSEQNDSSEARVLRFFDWFMMLQQKEIQWHSVKHYPAGSDAEIMQQKPLY